MTRRRMTGRDMTRRRNTRRHGAVLLLTALLAAVTSCSSGGTESEPGKVVLRVGDQKGAGIQEMMTAA
jgi:sulfonate transport system substrate-binding protein